MTKRELPAQAAKLQGAIASSSTCRTATVESLRTFLLPTERPTLQYSSKKTQVPVKIARRVPKLKEATGKPKRRPEIAILEVAVEELDYSTQVQERSALATATVNLILKALTEAIKNPIRKKRTLLRRTSSKGSVSNGAELRSQTPLQPRCINLISNTPGAKGSLRRSSSTALLDERLVGLRAQAECGRVAFAFLRLMNEQGDSPRPPDLQLEAGMSAMIGKLITLGIEDLALKELRILRKRLEARLTPLPDRKRNALTDSSTSEDASEAKAETLEEMLRFSTIACGGQLLALVIATQLQIVKIITLKKDPDLTQAALRHLRLDVSYSPANMIQRQIEEDSLASRTKAAQQLESFAQSLTALCSSPCSLGDVRPSKSINTLSSEAVFETQLLALRIRQIWWKLSGHQVNLVAELIDPFHRILSGFNRSSTLDKNEKYRIANAAFASIMDQAQLLQGPQGDGLLSVYLLLADIAQESAQYSKSLEWVKKGRLSIEDHNFSRVRLCSIDCRLASLQIRAPDFDHSEEICGALEIAASSLAGDLRGGPAELDDLLVHVAALRRSAFSVIQEAQKLPKPELSQSTLADRCFDIIFLCPRFVLRYIGKKSESDDEARSRTRCDHRRRLAAQVFTSTIDSVGMGARFSAKTTVDDWKRVDAGLRDCLSLALAIQDLDCDDRDKSTKGKRAPLPFASISNAYWYRYQYLKHSRADVKSIKDCLETSIEIIKDRDRQEQVAGSLDSKLEKYGQLCESTRDYEESVRTYQQALDFQIKLGYLAKAGEAAETRSLPHALEGDPELGALARILLTYPRVAAKAVTQNNAVRLFLDIEDLRPQERGLLLEQQLIALLSVCNGSASASTMCGSLTECAKTLLSIYTETSYPVRRLRVAVRVLATRSLPLDSLSSELQEFFLKSTNISKTGHSDTKLLQFLPILVTSQDLITSLRQQDLHQNQIEATIAGWSVSLCNNPSWNSLQLRIYDLSALSSLLELVADYLGMQGLELTRLAVVHIIVTICEVENSLDRSNLVSKLSALGLQYARLGYSGNADIVLRKAQEYVETAEVPFEIALRYHLSCAEHAHYAGKPKAWFVSTEIPLLNQWMLTSTSREELSQAQKLYDEHYTNDEIQRKRSEDRSRTSLVIADIYHVCSLLAIAEGQPMQALYNARVSVKSNQRSWALLEKSTGSRNKVQQASKETHSHDTLTDSFSELSATDRPPATPNLADLEGAASWGMVPRLFQNLIHLSKLFAHCGLFPEVEYYMGQAQKVADSAKAPALSGQQYYLFGKYLIQCGKHDQGVGMLQDAARFLDGIPHDWHFIQLQLSTAMIEAERARWENSSAAFTSAENTLRNLMTRSVVDHFAYRQPASDDLCLELERLRIHGNKAAVQSRNKRRPAEAKTRPGTKPTTKQSTTVCMSKDNSNVDSVVLAQMNGDLLRGRAFAAMCDGNLPSAVTLLEEAASMALDQQGEVFQALSLSRVQLRQGLEDLISNPVFCVLPESTISCPSARAGSERAKQGSKSQKSARAVATRTQRAKGSTSKARTRSLVSYKSELQFFELARTSLNEIFRLAKTFSMTSTVHQITNLLGKLLIMLSAAPSENARGQVSSAFMVYILETGRFLSMTRESMAINVERRLPQSHVILDWPRNEPEMQHETHPTSLDFEFGNFQADYIDIIPETWTVISMTLSESKEELMLCKIRAGQSPFVLKLPLSRPNALENEDESFKFDEAKAELQDIIRLTNESTHGGQDLSQKGAKTRWWEARTALDARLKDLLINIENVWLGGFRGIFSDEGLNQGLLARLQQSLQNILDKYLPSRQKAGRGNQAPRNTFDLQILELFVGLGTPTEANDIDDSLMDLLYFVVDILQFNGERNAYDEVDFDSIAIETTDALRQYHQAICDEMTEKTEQHTILILDKQLHCFPWESLPCLSGHAVSRLPSLRCLRDRILTQQERRGQSVGDCLTINKIVGAYILNPGGDLKATQERFEQPLQDLSGWVSVVQRGPAEPEMRNLLENSDVLLYFGHGSGGQYIRSRTIKRLDKCAVALLMGCSSGALTEAGEFEPYGTPMNYMHAGSPAVLATLWDVTDKDIDKFSQTVLEQWGLFGNSQQPVSSSPVKKSAKQKGKSKVEDAREMRDGGQPSVSLDMAVSRGRDSCILKYLNGAAPVVYGIPVSLS